MATGCACKKTTKKSQKEVVFEPIDDRVIIDPDACETQSPGGIVLPEGSADKPQIGIVLAVGPNTEQARPGDRVLFSPYAERVTLNEIEYVLVNEGDVYAILK